MAKIYCISNYLKTPNYSLSFNLYFYCKIGGKGGGGGVDGAKSPQPFPLGGPCLPTDSSLPTVVSHLVFVLILLILCSYCSCVPTDPVFLLILCSY